MKIRIRSRAVLYVARVIIEKGTLGIGPLTSRLCRLHYRTVELHESIKALVRRTQACYLTLKNNSLQFDAWEDLIYYQDGGK